MIDDNQGNLISLKALINESFPHVEIFTAQSGEAGIEIAKVNEPDVILLDILMPGMDGYETCRRLKANPRHNGIPVIFVTALKSDKENRLKALESGAEAFINKPIDEIEFYVQLRGMLKIRERNIINSNENEKLNVLVNERTKDIIDLKEKYKNILDDLPALICEFMPDSTLTYVNKTYCRYFQMSREDLIGKAFLDLLPENSREKVRKKYLSLSPRNPSNQYVHKVMLNGEEKWQEWRDSAIFDEQGLLKHFFSIGVDITERKKAEEKLLFLSYHDHMTGLYNRRFFEEEVKRLDKARNLPLTIVMADVNGLKLVNDSFGHAAGDELLKKAAKVIQEACRADDIIARVGGDEFALILPQTDRNSAENLIRRIRENIVKGNTNTYVLSISFGHATKSEVREDINEIFANAENYMYKHKAFESASMRSKTIEVIMNSLFEKSARESAHSKRVSQICELIALALNFDEDEINTIKIAGLVHDIGKISVDEKVLNKYGTLDEDEWIEIRKHPESSRRILSAVKEFAEISDYVVAHHERWDGMGYPNRLKGEEIPIESRIIAVADAYDAMTSQRSYRKPMSKKKAIDELKKNTGIQFDPEIVEAFLSIPNNAINSDTGDF
ncbi:MAG: diguanylate cyclase [Firmicutes bacterium HGW-Firmicutes-12]|nr:MAG: diguanylate cyclase [Firmicutes bacterium HGW-Firmicutes-12]